jgi:hypothetical protein
MWKNAFSPTGILKQNSEISLPVAFAMFNIVFVNINRLTNVYAFFFRNQLPFPDSIIKLFDKEKDHKDDPSTYSCFVFFYKI